LHQIAPGLGLSLSVAHLDHGVRGEAARADADFVAALAESLGLPFDLGRWQPGRSGHFEADARKARYAWLTQVARARGAGALAVGHTRDDQAETILQRIVRGTGLRGLSGMPARRLLGHDPPVVLVRPMLSIARRQIREHLQELGQPFRDDTSNTDRSRTRARIRHALLPLLAREYNPRVAEALVRLGLLAAQAESLVDDRLEALEGELILATGGNRVELARDRLSELPPFLRAEMLRRVWRKAGWPEAGMSAGHWERLAATFGKQPGRMDVGAGVVVRVTAGATGRIVLSRSAEPKAPVRPVPKTEVLLKVPGQVDWEGARIETVLDPDAQRDETVDLDHVKLPLNVRGAAPGDRFAPLGLQGRSTPLNDFFRSRKIPRESRARIPLVCDREGIIWVAGQRIADRVRTTGETRRTMGLRWTPAPGKTGPEEAP
jgi:tRNA(Ile)-lysidine synthase